MMNPAEFNENIMFTILMLFLLIIGPIIPVILLSEYFIRPIMMKKLAKEFGLQYQRNKGFISNDRRRNIITGKIGNHKVDLFDFAIPRSGPRPMTSKRHTLFAIDGEEETLSGKVSGYYPINKLREKLEHLRIV